MNARQSRRLICSLMFVLLGSTHLAADELADDFFSREEVVLTEAERKGLEISQRRGESDGSSNTPYVGPDGSVQFKHGVHIPSVVCAPLQICDIMLQPGELVNNLLLGDQGRWYAEPAITGAGPDEVQHVIVKVQDAALETSLVITTDRRTYHIKLRSHRTDYMPVVSFSYPDEMQADWDALRQRDRTKRADLTLPTTGEYLGDLSFDYSIKGKAPWRPVRVYNDGVKTIIQMPERMAQTEAPTLMLLRKRGGALSRSDEHVVNYRLQNDRYIVDSVFDRAVLIAGVGAGQTRITISRQ